MSLRRGAKVGLARQTRAMEERESEENKNPTPFIFGQRRETKINENQNEIKTKMRRKCKSLTTFSVFFYFSPSFLFIPSRSSLGRMGPKLLFGREIKVNLLAKCRITEWIESRKTDFGCLCNCGKRSKQ